MTLSKMRDASLSCALVTGLVVFGLCCYNGFVRKTQALTESTHLHWRQTAGHVVYGKIGQRSGDGVYTVPVAYTDWYGKARTASILLYYRPNRHQVIGVETGIGGKVYVPADEGNTDFNNPMDPDPDYVRSVWVVIGVIAGIIMGILAYFAHNAMWARWHVRHVAENWRNFNESARAAGQPSEPAE